MNNVEIRINCVIFFFFNKASSSLASSVFDTITGNFLKNRNLMEFHKINRPTFQFDTRSSLSVEILAVEVLSSEKSSAVYSDNATVMRTRRHQFSIQWPDCKVHWHPGCYGARNC